MLRASVAVRATQTTLALGLAAAIGWAVAAAAQAQPWRLGAEDMVRIVAPELPGVAGAYRLGEGGRIALPLAAGALRLGGMTLDEAADALRATLAADTVAPRLALELTEGRPFYIRGDVARPGAYPTPPGLTLGRALALAGGERRAQGTDRLTEAVTAIRATEEYRRSLRERVAAAVRRARLAAERSGAAGFRPPSDWLARLPVAEAEGLVAAEEALRERSEAAAADRAATAARLMAARRAEIAALEGRLDGAERQAAVIDAEIADARSLFERGVVPQTRLAGLLREADRYQGDILQITTQLNQARQAIVQLEFEQRNVPRARMMALTERLLDAEARIDQLDRALAAAAAVLDETGVAATEGPAALHFEIGRAAQPGAPPEATSDPSQPVAPGDLIVVRRSLVLQDGAP